MTKTFEELHILLTTDEDSDITQADIDGLIEFLQDKWDPSGNYEAHKFTERYEDNPTEEYNDAVDKDNDD